MNKHIRASLIDFYKKGTIRKFRKIFKLKRARTPYMKYKEIALFEELLSNLKPQKVLEYGCGFSSLHFLSFLPDKAIWHSVEHNQQWFEEVKQMATKKGVDNILKLHHVTAETESWLLEGDYKDFKNYVDFPEKLKPFQLVLVDGMARESCVKKAFELLADDGILVLHDANRKRYQDSLKLFDDCLILEDFRKTAGGFALASKGRNIESLIDLPYHAKIWAIDTQIVNFFKFKYLMGKKSKPFRIIRNGQVIS